MAAAASCPVAEKAGFALSALLPLLPPDFVSDGPLHIRLVGKPPEITRTRLPWSAHAWRLPYQVLERRATGGWGHQAHLPRRSHSSPEGPEVTSPWRCLTCWRLRQLRASTGSQGRGSLNHKVRTGGMKAAAELWSHTGLRTPAQKFACRIDIYEYTIVERRAIRTSLLVNLDAVVQISIS
jgi:hypothetical protein